MKLNKIYIDSKLSPDILQQMSDTICHCDSVLVNSNKEVIIDGIDPATIMNNGKKTIYLTSSKQQLKSAPECKAGFCPGFQKIVIASNGCPFSCEYCFLQATYRALHPFIKINCNTDDLIKELIKDIQASNGIPIYNAGEMLDSLALDEFTRISKTLVPFFADQDAYLLLLTKSDNIAGLKAVRHNGRTIVSWSINCETIINRYEHGTASLKDRIRAAKNVSKWGYPVRFRFDPLIVHENWEEHYKKMIKEVLSQVSPQRITIGSLRFVPSVKSFALKRFPDSDIFNYKFTAPQEDRKCRYELDLRHKLYSLVIDEIRKINTDVEIGFCKESNDVWSAFNLKGKGKVCNCLL